MFRNTLFQQISQSLFKYIFDRSVPNAILLAKLNWGKPFGIDIVKQNMQIKNIPFPKTRVHCQIQRDRQKKYPVASLRRV